MAPMCSCGKWVAERCAWTQLNARRRFLGCVDGCNGCGYFKWIDAPFYNRSQVVINGLLRRVRNNEEEEGSFDLERAKLVDDAAKWKKEAKKWKYFCWFLLFCIALLWLN
ncbi:hypothetical protein AgCh_034797 [Apium graveolens]